jgi:hypothetical protein
VPPLVDDRRIVEPLALGGVAQHLDRCLELLTQTLGAGARRSRDLAAFALVHAHGQPPSGPVVEGPRPRAGLDLGDHLGIEICPCGERRHVEAVDLSQLGEVLGNSASVGRRRSVGERIDP